MFAAREAGEKMGQAIAQKSPRLGGAFAILMAFAICRLGIYLQKATLLIVASLLFGGGVWVGLTGRNWKIPDDKPPMWWKIGFFIVGGASVAAAYAYIFSRRIFGF